MEAVPALLTGMYGEGLVARAAVAPAGAGAAAEQQEVFTGAVVEAAARALPTLSLAVKVVTPP